MRAQAQPAVKMQRVSSGEFTCPLTAYCLPAEIVDRAANGLGWISLICAVTAVALTLIEHVFQPEFAAAWTHPVLRLASLGVFLMSIALIVLQRAGCLSKRRLIDLGMSFSGGDRLRVRSV